MTTEEIIQVLRANIDQTVWVIRQDGDTDLALVLTVDNEGFVFDVVSMHDGERKTTAYWTPFSEVAEVQLAPDNSK